MDNSISDVPAAQAAPLVPATVTTIGKKRNTIPKLSAAEASKIPGATPPVVKKDVPAFIYSFVFVFADATSCWSAAGSARVHTFANQLDAQATAKGLGTVTAVVVADGSFDVTLTLTVAGKPASNGVPAEKLLIELSDFLSTASGTPYKVKVNGTTITPGVLP
jgi:hypothetical protein